MSEQQGWYLGGASGAVKVVHVAGCRYAKLPYIWANREGDVKAVAKALRESGAWRWHRGCWYCNRELNTILDSVSVS